MAYLITYAGGRVLRVDMPHDQVLDFAGRSKDVMSVAEETAPSVTLLLPEAPKTSPALPEALFTEEAPGEDDAEPVAVTEVATPVLALVPLQETPVPGPGGLSVEPIEPLVAANHECLMCGKKQGHDTDCPNFVPTADDLPPFIDIPLLKKLTPVSTKTEEGSILVCVREPYDILRLTRYGVKEDDHPYIRERLKRGRKPEFICRLIGRANAKGTIERPKTVSENVGFFSNAKGTVHLNRTFEEKSGQMHWVVYPKPSEILPKNLKEAIDGFDFTKFIDETNDEQLREMCLPFLIRTRAGLFVRIFSWNTNVHDKYDCILDGKLTNNRHPLIVGELRFLFEDKPTGRARVVKYFRVTDGQKHFVYYTRRDPKAPRFSKEALKDHVQLYVIEDGAVRKGSSSDIREFHDRGDSHVNRGLNGKGSAHP